MMRNPRRGLVCGPSVIIPRLRSRKAGPTYLLAAVLIALPLIATVPSSGGTAASKVIAVQLLDATDDPSMAGMQLTIDQDTVPAGPITFAVTNRSKSVTHELLVVKLSSQDTKLPYDEKDSKVIDGKLTKIVDSDDIKPGVRKMITVVMKPGDYLLICNQAGHYLAGMRTNLTVTK